MGGPIQRECGTVFMQLIHVNYLLVWWNIGWATEKVKSLQIEMRTSNDSEYVHDIFIDFGSNESLV